MVENNKTIKNELMARVRSKNGRAELLVFSYLRKSRIYFQKHYAKVPGKPDIALPRRKIAVFIDGDFWHGHDFNRRELQLTEYWLTKVSGNMKRDVKVNKSLKASGWLYLRVWESDINRKRTRDVILEKIKTFLAT